VYSNMTPIYAYNSLLLPPTDDVLDLNIRFHEAP
jgi:hypothetical protein